MSNWQPIETAPKDGTEFLVYTIHGDFEISHWYMIEYTTYRPVPDTDYYEQVPAHSEGLWNSNYFSYWTPLPKPPEPPE